MSHRRVHFDLAGELLPAQTEAAARRRLRMLEDTFAAVLEWEVAARSRPAADASGHRAEAHVAAIVPGGDRFRASASGTDALGALRLAFNALETRLHQENDDARHRAFHWIEKVKSRTSQSWFSAD